MKKFQLTSLARAIDFNYLTNKIIIILAISIPVLYLIFSRDLLLNGFFLGINIFLCWALNRELDPDNNLSAFLALIPLIFLSLYTQINNQLLPLFWLLLSLRILNRSTGQRILLSDYLGISLISFLISQRFENPLFIFSALLIFLFDLLYRKEQTPIPALALLVILGGWFLYQNPESFFSLKFPSLPTTYLFLLISIIYIILIDKDPNPVSLNDLGKEKISSVNLKSAQIFYILFILLISFSGISFSLYIILWYPVLGTVAERTIRKITGIFH